MENLDLENFSTEELKEIIHQQQDELKYKTKTVELLHKENIILKKEYYKLRSNYEYNRETLLMFHEALKNIKLPSSETNSKQGAVTNE